jgi:HD-like signal output (HDOD) protein
VGEVNVDYLKNGMVLASDLKDSLGRFLLGRGTVIEEKHIRVMKIWGITSADIEGTDQEHAAQEEMRQIDPQQLPKIQKYINSFFCDSAPAVEHEALKEIKRLCVLRVAQRIDAGFITISELEEKLQKDADARLSKPLKPPQEKIIPAPDLVNRSIQLSSFPDIYYQIIKVMNDTKSSASHLAEVVGNDPGLSAILLKMINSAFYGLPAKVSSIVRAIALIGGNELSTLAMGISVIRYFKDIPPEMVDMKKFWMHSVAVGVFARLLVHHKVGLSEEELFIGGLLHDIGRLVIFRAYPHSAAYAMQLAEKRRIPLFEAERKVLGYDHAAVAGLLLEKWNFPKTLQQMIKYHHLPLVSQRPLEAAIVSLSNILATAMRFGYSGNRFIPSFDEKIWAAIDLSTSVLMPSVKQADRQVNEVLRIFNLDKNST